MTKEGHVVAERWGVGVVVGVVGVMVGVIVIVVVGGVGIACIGVGSYTVVGLGLVGSMPRSFMALVTTSTVRVPSSARALSAAIVT